MSFRLSRTAAGIACILLCLVPACSRQALPGADSKEYAGFVSAFYVGLAVSVTIHWVSEFAAGAIIGSVIGMTVGKSFRTESQETHLH